MISSSLARSPLGGEHRLALVFENAKYIRQKDISLHVKSPIVNDKSKKIAIRPFQKKRGLISLGRYALGPQVLTYRPQILRGVRI